MKILTSREAFFGVLFFFAGGTASPGERQTENLILITIDGVRRQEMFGGLDLEIVRSLTKKGRVEDTSTYKKYWASTPEERRAKVMPFFWGTLMKDRGSIAGNWLCFLSFQSIRSSCVSPVKISA